MKKQIIQFLGVLTISALLYSCKGPAGEAGATGPQGPAGPAGPAGSPNVIYSSWFKLNPASSWRDTAAFYSYGSRYAVKTASAVTQSIIDQGVVLSYAKWTIPAGTTPAQKVMDPQLLPALIEFPVSTTAAAVFGFNFFPAPGKIFYTSYCYIDAYALPASLLVDVEYRYIIIPGGVAASRIISGPAKGYTVQQLKSLTYAQASALLNIPAEGSNIK